jgi:hypothetical protein
MCCANRPLRSQVRKTDGRLVGTTMCPRAFMLVVERTRYPTKNRYPAHTFAPPLIDCWTCFAHPFITEIHAMSSSLSSLHLMDTIASTSVSPPKKQLYGFSDHLNSNKVVRIVGGYCSNVHHGTNMDSVTRISTSDCGDCIWEFEFPSSNNYSLSVNDENPLFMRCFVLLFFFY